MRKSAAVAYLVLGLTTACGSEAGPAADGGAAGSPGVGGGASGSAGTPSSAAGEGGGLAQGGAASSGAAAGSSPLPEAGNSGAGAVAGAAGSAGAASTGGAVTGGAGAGGSSAGGSSAGGSSAGGTGAGGAGGTTSSGGLDPGTEGDGDIMVGPSYPVAPELTVKSGVPRGATYKFTMSSSSSKFYTGMDSTLSQKKSFTRNVLVYVPKQYKDGNEAPFIVSQDLQYGYETDIMNALDTLIDAKSIPALVAVFVDNGGGDSYGSERGLEYDTVSDKYQRFVDAEVLPAVTSNSAIKKAYPNFKLTADPEGRGTYGCSSGAAAAFTMGFMAPNAYRRLITYSGTFVDQQDSDAAEEKMYPNGAWEFHDTMIPAAERKPLRVFLAVGENDNGATNTEASHHNWVMANQRMAAALKAKGYHYRFVYAKGAKHCDGAVRKHTLPDTLRWMWRGYPIQ